jgi:hypothetical protein
LIGWIIISLALLNVLVTIASIFYGVFSQIYDKIKELLTKKRLEKVKEENLEKN